MSPRAGPWAPTQKSNRQPWAPPPSAAPGPGRGASAGYPGLIQEPRASARPIEWGTGIFDLDAQSPPHHRCSTPRPAVRIPCTVAWDWVLSKETLKTRTMRDQSVNGQVPAAGWCAGETGRLVRSSNASGFLPTAARAVSAEESETGTEMAKGRVTRSLGQGDKREFPVSKMVVLQVRLELTTSALLCMYCCISTAR